MFFPPPPSLLSPCSKRLPGASLLSNWGFQQRRLGHAVHSPWEARRGWPEEEEEDGAGRESSEEQSPAESELEK